LIGSYLIKNEGRKGSIGLKELRIGVKFLLKKRKACKFNLLQKKRAASASRE